MKILLTQRKLDAFSGTELVTLELASALKRRGHDVCVYCPRPGRVCNLLASNGVTTHKNIDGITWRPDVIHGHHQLPTMVALAAFQDVPAVYVCHGVRPWVEQPPLHPCIQVYIAVSEKLASHIAAKYSIPEDRIAVIPNFADTRRFSTVRSQNLDKPTKAVLFGQTFQAEEVQRLEDACKANGLVLDKIGAAYGNIRTNPELLLPDYDIAFAVGRSAIEAMACGCAVIPIMPHLAGSLVTPENLFDWKQKNFSPRFFTTADRISPAWLKEQLTKWSAQGTEEVTDEIRRSFSLDTATECFEKQYIRAAKASSKGNAHNALTAYLEKLAFEVDENWEIQQGVTQAQLRQAAALKDQTAALRQTKKQLHFLSNRILSTPEAVKTDSDKTDWEKFFEANGLFDREWYLATNPDVAEAGMDPLVHYITYGAAEGRTPSPLQLAATDEWSES